MDDVYARWDALSADLYDGNQHIDNNLFENAIRSVALGRKITSSQESMKQYSMPR